MQPVLSTGKRQPGAMRGKTRKRCQARENTERVPSSLPSKGIRKTMPSAGKLATSANRRKTRASQDAIQAYRFNANSFQHGAIVVISAPGQLIKVHIRTAGIKSNIVNPLQLNSDKTRIFPFWLGQVYFNKQLLQYFVFYQGETLWGGALRDDTKHGCIGN